MKHFCVNLALHPLIAWHPLIHSSSVYKFLPYQGYLFCLEEQKKHLVDRTDVLQSYSHDHVFDWKSALGYSDLPFSTSWIHGWVSLWIPNIEINSVHRSSMNVIPDKLSMLKSSAGIQQSQWRVRPLLCSKHDGVNYNTFVLDSSWGLIIFWYRWFNYYLNCYDWIVVSLCFCDTGNCNNSLPCF
jgi:hypothetical protein